MEQHTPVEIRERGPLEAKINTLKAELTVKKKILDETRELLKIAEQENLKLKASLEELINSKKENFLRKIMGDLTGILDNVKFQSPIVKKES